MSSAPTQAQQDAAAASGMFDPDWITPTTPTDSQARAIFARIESMAGVTLQQAYQEALAFAREVKSKAQALMSKHSKLFSGTPEIATNPVVKLVQGTDDELVGKLNATIALVVMDLGRQLKYGGHGTIDRDAIARMVNAGYDKANVIVKDTIKVPTSVFNIQPPRINDPDGKDDEIVSEFSGLALEYGIKAKALLEKYSKPVTRDEVTRLLQNYYVDQLNPGWTPDPMPTTCGADQIKASDGLCYARCVGADYTFNDSTHKCEKRDGEPVAVTDALKGVPPKPVTSTIIESFLGFAESFTEFLPSDGGLSQQREAAAAYRAAEDRVALDREAQQQALQAQHDGTNTEALHDNNRAMYQSSRLKKQTSDMINDFLANTPTPRPATAGTADSVAAKERAKILKIQAMHLYVIQVALLTILFCLLALWLLPEWAAHMVIILILATGIAAAIYLSQIQ
jgi:hypothetical protein